MGQFLAPLRAVGAIFLKWGTRTAVPTESKDAATLLPDRLQRGETHQKKKCQIKQSNTSVVYLVFFLYTPPYKTAQLKLRKSVVPLLVFLSPPPKKTPGFPLKPPPKRRGRGAKISREGHGRPGASAQLPGNPVARAWRPGTCPRRGPVAP